MTQTVTIAVQIPSPEAPFPLEVSSGRSIVFIGANGSGKTRLGAYIEQVIGESYEVHRIAAHRSLVMNTSVQPGSSDRALNKLFYGYEQGAHIHRTGHRWQGKPATVLLSDFDDVVRALYADENSVSVLHRQSHIKDVSAKPPSTKLDQLRTIWQSLLPYCDLIVSAGSIRVKRHEAADNTYDPSELSDGERVIFYLLGQCLLVRPNCVVIIDEPELHIHRAILPKLWDAIETTRKDCAIIYLTHDLEFATSRHAALKIVCEKYDQSAEQWQLAALPENTDIPEDVVSKILGSRQPVLFIEGDGASLDVSIYRRVYDGFSVIPIGTCDQVIHCVTSFTRHPSLHRIGCAGLIDADDRNPDEIVELSATNVYTLSVPEIENLLLLPEVFAHLAKNQKFNDSELETKLGELKAVVFKSAHANLDYFALEYTKRRIDRKFKTIGLAASDIATLSTEFSTVTSKVLPNEIYSNVRTRLETLCKRGDYRGVLCLYSNKGLLADAARILGLKNKTELEEIIGRILRSEDGKGLLAALLNELPTIAGTPTS